MVFQTEKQLKEFGDKLSDDKKKPIEDALAELKKAHETQEVDAIQPAMEKINEAWKALPKKCTKHKPSKADSRVDHNKVQPEPRDGPAGGKPEVTLSKVTM